jgi:hypothetical protein
MRTPTRSFLQLAALALAAVLVLGASAAHAQIAGGTDVNMSKMANYQNECAIAKNPTNKMQLFALCNNSTGGLFAARSTTLGATWVYPDPSKTIANGTAGLGPLACCDPTLAWDNFGNLFIGYLGNNNTVEIILSTDGGQTFTNLLTINPGVSVDQPTVAAGSGQVWVVWNNNNQMNARGAAVTGLGAVGTFGAAQAIPGTVGCSFGDLAIAPNGAVVQVCESPSGTAGPANLLVNTDADGLGPGNFGAAVTATATNVGGFDFITPQATRSVDAEAGLAFDANPSSPHFGRLYLVYTDAAAIPSNDTNIFVRFSDNNGATWPGGPIQVNDDATTRAQFLPRIASNPLSGNIAVCWHDARNSAGNNSMEVFCSMATPTGANPVFFANGQIGDALSTGQGSNPPGVGLADIQFGDYAGLAYFQGRAHPAWADNSNSTGDNPNTTTRYDAYTDTVSGGASANEGDPHITTVDNVHYDFQSAGEFIVLRDADGLQIQTRQSPVATSGPLPNDYTGLNTCVSLNTAVAAKVGSHRVTWQPNSSGQPDPSGLQLRIDGNLTTLTATGINLAGGGRVSQAGSALQVDFPDDSTLLVTPGWWPAHSVWYLNVDVFHTPALEGIMGAKARASWLPALYDGTPLGAKPTDAHQRYLQVYEKFANSWRVNEKDSLFDYAPGTKPATYRFPTDWPRENPETCDVPKQPPPVRPLPIETAQRLCAGITDKFRRADCIADVHITAEAGFAKTYLASQRIVIGSTTTRVSGDPDRTRADQPVVFTAVVSRNLMPRGREVGRKGAPTGQVQFTVDGEKAEGVFPLDRSGTARWKTASLRLGKHQITATFVPSKGSPYLSSSGVAEHLVLGEKK